MVSTIARIVRLVTLVGGTVAGVREVRHLYFKRKHMWKVLRRMVRQLG